MKKILNIVFILLAAVLITGCGEDEEKDPEIRQLGAYSINVPEPSGLSFTHNKSGLWTVSDASNKIYRLDFEGNVISSFEVNSSDLEGIAIINEDTLAVVSESDHEIIQLTTTGKRAGKFNVENTGSEDSGLEGLAYDPVNKMFYAANEKSPKVIIKLDRAFNEINRYEISFAEDLAGLNVDGSFLWVLSEESNSITKCSLECEALESWKIDAAQPEGIAVDYSTKKAYIVSDSQSSLAVYQLP